MSDLFRFNVRTWVLGATAAGFLGQSIIAVGQSGIPAGPNVRKPIIKPRSTPEDRPRLLRVPNDSDVEKATIQPVSQIEVAANQKSEVQRQLEKLYEQDGREMPTDNLNMNMQPLAPANGIPQTTAPAAQPTAPQTTRSLVVKTPPAQQPARPAVQGYKQYQPIANTRTAATSYPPVQPTTQAPRNYAQAIDAHSVPANQPVTPQVKQSQPGKVGSFFKKLIPGNNSNKQQIAQAPVPPDIANRVPDVPPASSTLARQTNPPGLNPAISSGTRTNIAQATQALRSIPQVTAMPPAPSLNRSQLSPNVQVSVFNQPNSLAAETAMALPPLQTKPVELVLPDDQRPLPTLKSTPDVVITERPSERPTNDFPNPFPEVTETEADLTDTASPFVPGMLLEAVEPAKRMAIKVAKSAPQVEVDPFIEEKSDLAEPVISEQAEQAELSPPVAPTTPPVVEVVPEVTPVPKVFFVPRRVTEGEPRSIPTTTAEPKTIEDDLETIEPKPAVESKPAEILATPAPVASPEITPPQLVDLNPETSGTSLDAPTLLPPNEAKEVRKEPRKETHLEKMRRIRERFGMKGLKGFCPVTLHDERELVDAKTEFHYLHRSQKFHFASSEARDKFLADPVQYTPAAYGADVVALSRDKDVVEGTLDYAAWFKGRLYLFGSQATHDTFMADPSQFATPSGIE